ncbi:Glycosyltransferase involved in cell wall bisynthesis [Enhydrobacter aerosaccus]|uniref:Glycosyltransferase involved in cell wall bisynthesis n=1 Tax=Enhydrobacter aerosaccus TaxID=225324 RepID=A0A1T4NRG1_9HYPH|nr:glycosyltransferase [Enhydrobacter aerosaccus]SJZ81861.1 Glycosyltransferase involved in cell wall bisynthesis [Enhydrobacter aerosaccus]
MPAPKLLQIVPSLSGSIGRATLDTAQAVIAAGGTAVVASPGGTMVADLLRLRASHLELPAAGHPLWARLNLPARLAASVRQLDLDLIHARSPLTAWIAGAVARRLRTKWIATLHQPFLASNLLASHIERQQLRADGLIAVSEHVASDLRHRLPESSDRLDVIPTGVNLHRFDPAVVRADRVIKLAAQLRVPDGAHVVLYPGRFVQDRGQKLLVDAIGKLGRDDVFCLFLGSTSTPMALEKDLERAIETAGLNGKVQIGPYVDDMPAAYMLADVVVTTGGARQGFSRVMIEAQAMGRPVVCEQGGGAAEAIVEGITGWTAPEGDPAGFAEAIGAALSLSVERRAELARAGQDNVRARYSLAEANMRLLQFYERLRP